MTPTEIAIDAEITVSELRSEDALDGRLRHHAVLRLRRRNDLLGVIVSLPRWKDIEERMRMMGAEIERLQDAADAQIVEERATAEYVRVTDEAWEEVEERYRALARARAEKRA